MWIIITKKSYIYIYIKNGYKLKCDTGSEQYIYETPFIPEGGLLTLQPDEPSHNTFWKKYCAPKTSSGGGGEELCLQNGKYFAAYKEIRYEFEMNNGQVQLDSKQKLPISIDNLRFSNNPDHPLSIPIFNANNDTATKMFLTTSQPTSTGGKNKSSKNQSKYLWSSTGKKVTPKDGRSSTGYRNSKTGQIRVKRKQPDGTFKYVL